MVTNLRKEIHEVLGNKHFIDKEYWLKKILGYRNRDIPIYLKNDPIEGIQILLSEWQPIEVKLLLSNIKKKKGFHSPWLRYPDRIWGSGMESLAEKVIQNCYYYLALEGVSYTTKDIAMSVLPGHSAPTPQQIKVVFAMLTLAGFVQNTKGTRTWIFSKTNKNSKLAYFLENYKFNLVYQGDR